MAAEATIRNLTNPVLSPAAQRREFELLRALNAEQLKQSDNRGDNELEAVVSSYELAWRMQTSAPDVIWVSTGRAGSGRAR